ncbi:MAG TPA: error-prone DNA polymerase [Longimicrobiales bacterium]
MPRSSYIELRCHSAFSFGDGVCTPEALVERAAVLGYPALGLTDHADLGGVIRFALEAERQGIRPVIGAEILVDGYPTAFLVRDAVGYRNLAGLVTQARVGPLADCGASGTGGTCDGGGGSAEDGGGRWSRRSPGGGAGRGNGGGDGGGNGGAGTAGGRGWRGATRERGRASLSFEEVAERAEGLYALTGPMAGEIPSLLRACRPEEAIFALDRWRAVFGERLVVEVQRHQVSGEESALAAALIELAERSRVPWVVTNDPRYLDGAGRLVHDLFTALRAGLDVDGAASRGLLLPNGEWRLKSPHEMQHPWRGREAGIAATHAIALDCRFDLRWVRPPLPRFPVPAGHDDDSWLRTLVYRGAAQRWGEPSDRHLSQIEHELGVIRRLGFAGFFLVMWDAVRFARERGILCQGRGSAANSAVAYCLGITAVDPVAHGLLFERFLSEARTDGRTEAPDIDVDFEMHRREEVLDFMYARYGRRHAAITCTIQTYHAPNAVQDVMRALGYPAERALALSKRLHRVRPSEGAARIEKELAARHGLDLANPRGRALLTAIRALDDVPRLRATHPGGFVLSSAPLGEHLPIEHTPMGRTIVQFDKDDLDAAGVPKFDFLGLGGLSAIRLAFDAIERRTGERLELYDLPVDDPATFELIRAGETIGTFQIESRAQIQSILQTRPERLYDLVVQVALIRPGPIQARFVRPYTRRRRGLEPVSYAHPLLEPILRRTYGIPIFQEQAMAISMALGGFTAAEADELRRAMGNQRKLPRLHAVLERLKRRIITHVGADAETAAGIVDDLYSFANYGFPESHAWSFALIAYATAYLKAHYPAEFYLGLLNAWPMGFYSPATLVHEARRRGVIVLGPCLRDGEWDCTIEPPAPGAGAAEVDDGDRAGAHGAPALRIGWRHIRGLGEKTREALRAARAERPFTSIDDVVRRARLTRAEALHLARAGAFEAFEPGRRKAAWAALRAAGDRLPLAPTHHLPFDPRELERDELIFLDYLATGICTHGHPMEHLRARLEACGVTASSGIGALAHGANAVVAGLVVARQRPATAGGTVFTLLEDEDGWINVVVPARLYDRNREVVSQSPFLLVEGRIERTGEAVQVIGRRFRRLEARTILYQARDFR